MRALVVALALLGAACASPVGIERADARTVHRYLTQNALSSDLPSAESQIELRRYDLLARFDEDPDAALAELHEKALAADLPRDALYALAELSFVRAERGGGRERYAAAGLYAYAFLFPEEERPPLPALDPRERTAADIYNRALSLAMVRREDGSLLMREHGEITLGIGTLSVEVDTNAFRMGDFELYDFAPVTELEVRGFRNRYRRAGIGAPLAAKARPAPGATPPLELGQNARVPVTALLEIDRPLAGIRERAVHGRVHLFPTLEVDDVVIGGRRVPLEAEPTAALAAGLTESRFWEREIQLFLGNSLGFRQPSGLGGVRPYVKGRIPVVFVHGTASSPARWADMVNDLLADPALRHRYAFWFFWYDSGNPIAYSGWRLREALTRAVTGFDPSGTDPCLGDTVVLGHSQGGLLTKLTAIDSGDRFWSAISSKPFDEVSFSDADRTLLHNALFVKPLPFVKRVMFLATPHQGSYLAGPQIVRRLAERLVRLPSDVARLGADLATLGPTGAGALALERTPTSIDNMSPGNRYIRVLSQIPVAPGIHAHSIIAVDADGPLDTAGDGVVKYESAHVDGIESELIVRSVHSGMQAQAATIEEVRRILLLHSAASACPIPSSPTGGEVQLGSSQADQGSSR